MCMCDEWMGYDDDGDNNGESLNLLLLFWGDTYLSYTLKLFEENEVLYIFFFFSFLSGGYLVPLILLSDTCHFYLSSHFFFSSRFRALAPFYFLVSSFFRALISLNNIASGSNQYSSSIYFIGNNRDRIIFLAILSRIRSRILLGGSGDGNEWIYVDTYFQSRSSIYEWTCK